MTASQADFYVAPPGAPASRRPPITEAGPLAWLRQNLFSGVKNTVATLALGALLIWFIYEFLAWSVHSAQWSVVFNNLRLMTSGQYPPREIWRVELTAAVLVFLTGLGMGVWTRLARNVLLTVVVLLAALFIVPLLSARIPAPSVYVLLDGQAPLPQFVFFGRGGQRVSFEIEPLTTVEAMERRPLGYLEFNSRTRWSTQASAAEEGALDLSQYTLALTATLTDRAGSALPRVAPVSASPDQPGATLAATLPRDGWYTLKLTAPEGEATGYAWLRVNDVTLFPTQPDAVAALEADYGARPAPKQAVYADEQSYLFQGTRTFAEFISLQVAPFFRKVAFELFVGAALFFNGWVIGTLGKRELRVRRAAAFGWAAVPLLLIVLYGVGGSRALPVVTTSLWGGLLLTILLTVVGIAASFPLGVALALGRRSALPVVKWTSTVFIEVVRGVPLITILFMAKMIVPFFASGLSNLDLTIRMMIGLTLFSAAYLAENVRGGLQIIPHGQIEAARALGMGSLLTTTLIVLPQALRAVIPAIVGQFISLFKDTSLVAVVGLFELVGIVDIIVSGQPIYRPYQREAYIFVAVVYFVISYAMSDVSRRLESSGAGSLRRQT